jgi:hypothetical protein
MVSNQRMAGVRVAMLSVLFSVLPAVAADTVIWGPANDELRISISLGGKADSREIRVTFEDLAKQDILIPLGMSYGGPHPTFLTVMLKTANGESPKVVYTGVGAVEGVVEPLTMGLRAGETYTMALPMDRYYMLQGSEKLVAFIKQPCQLWVELEVTQRQCPNPMALDPLRRTLPCWQGKVASNVLQMPN